MSGYIEQFQKFLIFMTEKIKYILISLIQFIFLESLEQKKTSDVLRRHYLLVEVPPEWDNRRHVGRRTVGLRSQPTSFVRAQSSAGEELRPSPDFPQAVRRWWRLGGLTRGRDGYG